MATQDAQADLKQFLELQKQFVDASNKLKQARDGQERLPCCRAADSVRGTHAGGDARAQPRPGEDAVHADAAGAAAAAGRCRHLQRPGKSVRALVSRAAGGWQCTV